MCTYSVQGVTCMENNRWQDDVHKNLWIKRSFQIDHVILNANDLSTKNVSKGFVSVNRRIDEV